MILAVLGVQWTHMLVLKAPIIEILKLSCQYNELILFQSQIPTRDSHKGHSEEDFFDSTSAEFLPIK